jgi:hypothetical protein
MIGHAHIGHVSSEGVCRRVCRATLGSHCYARATYRLLNDRNVTPFQRPQNFRGFGIIGLNDLRGFEGSFACSGAGWVKRRKFGRAGQGGPPFRSSLGAEQRRDRAEPDMRILKLLCLDLFYPTPLG